MATTRTKSSLLEILTALLGKDKNTVPETVRDLVCVKCWRGFFQSEAFDKACSANFQASHGARPMFDSYPAVKQKILPAQVHKSSQYCKWCSLVSFLLRKGNPVKARGPLIVTLRQRETMNAVPIGCNSWILSFEQPPGALQNSWRLLAYTKAQDVAAAQVTARPIERSLNTKAIHAEIKSWLQECLRSHDECLSLKEPALPTRVIDLVPENGPARPRLRVSAGCQGRYAALSYCWGNSQTAALTSTTLEEYLQDLPMEAFPQTIVDAIVTASSIGVRYLWIDALCILQDSESDKVKEISNMAQIYANALVTIVASSAAAASEGFLERRQFENVVFRIPFKTEVGRIGTMTLHRPLNTILDPIDRRGWTYQEKLVSSRLIIFNSQTLMWRCRQLSCNAGQSLCDFNDVSFESFPSAQQRATLSRANTPTTFPDTDFTTSIKKYPETMRWQTIVEQYTLRRHTVPADKLPALGAVAQTLLPLYGCDYFAGVWRRDMLSQLAWKCRGPSGLRVVQTYRAPSWSWASIDGPVTHYSTAQLQPICKVIECQITLKSPSLPFGEVMGGHLTLEGHLRRGRYFLPHEDFVWQGASSLDWYRRRKTMPIKTFDLGELVEEWVDFFALLTPEVNANHDEEEFETGQEKTVGLMLMLVHDGLYHRVGSFGSANFADFQQMPRQTITII